MDTVYSCVNDNNMVSTDVIKGINVELVEPGKHSSKFSGRRRHVSASEKQLT